MIGPGRCRLSTCTFRTIQWVSVQCELEGSLRLVRRMIMNHALTLVCLLIIYSVAIFAIANSKDLQTFLVFLPNVRFPLAKLTNLKYYGLDEISRNVEVQTSDGNVLKGWHLYDGVDRTRDISENQLAHCSRIIVYFHGNAFTRGFPNRIRKMRKLSREFDAHVLVFDYSGFADSTGYPSEITALNDAMSILKYVNSTVLKNNMAASGWYTSGSSVVDQNQPKLYFYGHSLGTGISTSLIHHLTTSDSNSNKNPISGLILDSPFTSIPDVVGDHILIKYFEPIRNYV